jgi:hypothetical protein
MPGKNAKPAKNRPELNSTRRKLITDDNTSNKTTTTENNSDYDHNSVRSRSPLKSNVRTSSTTNSKNLNQISKSKQPTLTETTLSQAGSASNSSPPKDAKRSQPSPTKTAIGQAGKADVASASGEDELIVTNDESFPEDMDALESRATVKRKREADHSPAQGPSNNPQDKQKGQDETWTLVQNKGNPSYRIPKSSGNHEDLRNKIPKQADLRQQLQRQQQPPQQQHTYANATGRGHHPTPQPTWGPLELRIYVTNFRQAPMDQQTWTDLHLHVMELVQNEAENVDASEEDLKIIEAKKMWWHAKLECGVIEVYSREALEWYKSTINKIGNRIRAWTWMEKPEPRLKVWIKPQFSHLSSEKYIELCLKFHPQIKNQPWKLESTSNDDGNRRTAYIRTSQEILMYLQNEGAHLDKFTIKGFCGVVVFAIAKEAPDKILRRPSPSKSINEAAKSASSTASSSLPPSTKPTTPRSPASITPATPSSSKATAAAATTTTSLPPTTGSAPASQRPPKTAPTGMEALELPPPQIPAEVAKEIRKLAAQTEETTTRQERPDTTNPTSTPTTTTTTSTPSSLTLTQPI